MNKNMKEKIIEEILQTEEFYVKRLRELFNSLEPIIEKKVKNEFKEIQVNSKTKK
jgi:hypothetical protein